MNKLVEQNLTTADKLTSRKSSSIILEEAISAAKYYMGVPDGRYFKKEDFDESVVNAKKAYITLNTLMGGETAERDRFDEGKKQIPELITSLGIKTIINLFIHLYYLGKVNPTISFETVRACRQSEIAAGESTNMALISTTKLSIEEIMKLGYGNKNKLAICQYQFHDGAVVLDMETLGKDYLKPEEREVLILMGNKLITHCCGYKDHCLGKDGKLALMYAIDVYPPQYEEIEESYCELEELVYDEKKIAEVRMFYTTLNMDEKFPAIPNSYLEWKKAFQKLVFCELKRIG